MDNIEGLRLTMLDWHHNSTISMLQHLANCIREKTFDLEVIRIPED